MLRALPVITLLVIASSAALHAQPGRRGGFGGPGALPQGTITGTVLDSAEGGVLYRASVSIRNASDSVLVTGAITEKDGSFTITGVRPGRYYARVTYVGYLPRTISAIAVAPGNTTVDLGKIILAPNAALGDEVTVKARRDFMTVGIDRTTYKTSELKVASGGSASDVLRNIPAIDVDKDGNVSLKGSQNVVIQINGRSAMVSGTMLASMLKSLPANALDRVEVIPNPSAKYDPDGMSGIINLVLAQNTNRGFSGGLNGSLGVPSSYNVGGTLSYGNGPWSLFGNYGFTYNDRTDSGSNARRLFGDFPVPYLDETSSSGNISRAHLFNTNVEYALSREHSIALSGMANLRRSTRSGLNAYIERDTSGQTARRYDLSSHGDEASYSYDARLDHKWVLEAARHELATEVRYAFDHNDNDADYSNRDLQLIGTDSIPSPALQNIDQAQRHRTLVFQTDYSRPIGDAGRMEAGYKGENETIHNDYASESFDYATGTYRPDVALNNAFDYDRTIHAAYLTYGHDFGTVAAQAGLRAEQVYTTFDLATTGQSFRNDYFSLFPSAFVTFKPDDAFQFKASFSRRINRPRTMTLNPFPNSEDPHFRRVGNPNLKPEYTNAYEVSMTHFADNATLTVTGFFRRTTDVLRRFSITDTTGVTTATWTNFDVNKTYGADVTATLRLNDWFSGFIFVSGYQNVTDASNVDPASNTDAFQWMLRGNATVTMLEGLDLQATYFYRPKVVSEGSTMADMQMLELALQQKVFGDAGRLGLRVSDPFNAQRFSIVRADAASSVSAYWKWTSRVVALTFSYTFGAPDKRRQRMDQPSGPNPMDME